MSRLFLALMVCAWVGSVSAQVIYEPMRYQYRIEGRSFYYGGNDPDVFRVAEREHAQAKNGFAEVHGDVMIHRAVSALSPRVYVDALPRANATQWGYTIDDARNAAARNMPRYFRKRDLLAHAVPDETGAWHVPAQVSDSSHRGTIVIKPYAGKAPALRRPVFVFPKHLLDRKLEPEKRQVVLAG